MDKTRLSPGEYRVTEALPNPFVACSSEDQGAGQRAEGSLQGWYHAKGQVKAIQYREFGTSRSLHARTSFR